MLGKVLAAVTVLIILGGGGIFFVRHTAQGQRICISSCMEVQGCSTDVMKSGTHQLDVSCLTHQSQCRTYCGADAGTAPGSIAGGLSPGHLLAAMQVGKVPPPKVQETHDPFFGALAYDSGSGAWGLGEPQKNADAAKASAMKFCLRYGTGCKVVDTFYNTCVAVATGKNSTIAWSKNDNLQQAKEQASVNCFKQAKSMCDVKLTNCYLQ